MSSCSTMMTEMLLLLFRLLSVSLLSPRVVSLFLIQLRGGAHKIDLPLFIFSLVNTIFTSLFSDLTLLVGETKTIVLVKALLGEEKLYPKSVQLEADF